ncbi:MAG TPA: hypothetical protein VNT54_09695 [Solirubrobacteraceae bacterium]|nr:hypothetical protein [Solirubrobacteraceae bacterium]
MSDDGPHDVMSGGGRAVADVGALGDGAQPAGARGRRLTMRGLAAAGASALLLALAGCGEQDEPAAPSTTAASDPVELTVVYDDARGRTATGTLTCRGTDRRAEGALYRGVSAAELCARVRGLRDLLTREPDRTRACTQIYGGPQTARVTGTIGDEKVDRRFSRTNGCEIADYRRAAGMLRP